MKKQTINDEYLSTMVTGFSQSDYGPSEIITHGEDGILVPAGDVDALARTMEKLIQDEPERKRLAQNAQESVKRFYIDNIMKQWERLIQKIRHPGVIPASAGRDLSA